MLQFNGRSDYESGGQAFESLRARQNCSKFKIVLQTIKPLVPSWNSCPYGVRNCTQQHACQLGLEGIVAKRRDRPYRPDAPAASRIMECTGAWEMGLTGQSGNAPAGKTIPRRRPAHDYAASKVPGAVPVADGTDHAIRYPSKPSRFTSSAIALSISCFASASKPGSTGFATSAVSTYNVVQGGSRSMATVCACGMVAELDTLQSPRSPFPEAIKGQFANF